MTAASLVPSALSAHLSGSSQSEGQGDPPTSELSPPQPLGLLAQPGTSALTGSPPSLCSGIGDSSNGYGDFRGGQLLGHSPVLEVLLGKPTEVPWTCLWITGWLKGSQTPTMNFSFGTYH